MTDFSLSGWALVAIAVFWAVLVGFLVVVLLSLFRVLTSTRDMIEDLRRETTPMLHELNQTVATMNRELEHVDEILDNVKGTTAAVEGITRTAQAAVANPAIRALALAAGAGRAYMKFRSGRER